jgi:hypothetical protein
MDSYEDLQGTVRPIRRAAGGSPGVVRGDVEGRPVARRIGTDAIFVVVVNLIVNGGSDLAPKVWCTRSWGKALLRALMLSLLFLSGRSKMS